MASYERRSRATAVPSFCYNGRVAQLAERVCEKHETVVQIPRRHTFILFAQWKELAAPVQVAFVRYRTQGDQMHTPDEFLKRATECDGMAKFTRDPQSSTAWKGMAQRWRQCAERAKRESSIVRSVTPRRRPVQAAAEI
jgi:hypothetical protein